MNRDIFAAVSSSRYKQGIAAMGSRRERVLQLRPATFAYKDDAKVTMHYGLVGEEVAGMYPQLVTYALIPCRLFRALATLAIATGAVLAAYAPAAASDQAAPPGGNPGQAIIEQRLAQVLP